MNRLMILLALVWSTGIGMWFAFGPVYSGSRTVEVSIPTSSEQLTVTGTLPPHAEDETSSGLAVNGPIVLLVLAVPVLLAAAPLIAPRNARRIVAGGAAGLTLVGAAFGALSIGLFYLPSAAALGCAALLPIRGSEPPPNER
jgi:hypothetical protein